LAAEGAKADDTLKHFTATISSVQSWLVEVKPVISRHSSLTTPVSVLPSQLDEHKVCDKEQH